MNKSDIIHLLYVVSYPIGETSMRICSFVGGLLFRVVTAISLAFHHRRILADHAYLSVPLRRLSRHRRNFLAM